MKPHIRKVRGIWTVRACEKLCVFSGKKMIHLFMPDRPYPTTGHGYTVREACEDWKAQMQAQRA